MCTGMEVVAVFGMITGQAGQNAQANAQERGAHDRRILLNEQADDIVRKGVDNVAKVHKQARISKSRATVQTARAGAVVGDGSHEALQDKITAMAEADALATMSEADNMAEQTRQGAQFDYMSSMNQASARRTQAYGQLISGIGSVANQKHKIDSYNPTTTTASQTWYMGE